MTLKLYAHPFSSYSQKVLIALYENGTPFEYRTLEQDGAVRELEALWPLKRFPVLVDGERTLLDDSITNGLLFYDRSAGVGELGGSRGCPATPTGAAPGAPSSPAPSWASASRA
jgi:hypothetical protein